MRESADMGARRTGRSPVTSLTEWNERELVAGLISRQPQAVRHFLERTHHALFCMTCRLTSFT